MNDVMEQIKTLSATLDEETTRFHPTGRLLLLGSYESVFLKAVKRKADLLGIDCDLTQFQLPLCEQDWSAHRERVAQPLCEKGA